MSICWSSSTNLDNACSIASSHLSQIVSHLSQVVSQFCIKKEKENHPTTVINLICPFQSSHRPKSAVCHHLGPLRTKARDKESKMPYTHLYDVGKIMLSISKVIPIYMHVLFNVQKKEILFFSQTILKITNKSIKKKLHTNAKHVKKFIESVSHQFSSYIFWIADFSHTDQE